MSPAKVVRVDELAAVQVLGGPLKPVFNPRTVGTKFLRFAVGTVAPGEGLVIHVHPGSEEVYYVIRGRGTVRLGEEREKVPIEEGMALYIPPGTPHGVKNTGDVELDVAFFVAPGGEPTKTLE